LLAGIAQTMVAGRTVENLDELLARTAALAQNRAVALPVPRGFVEVADALRAVRGSFEAGGIFPPHVIDRTLDALEQM
jgi:hypothetical protein